LLFSKHMLPQSVHITQHTNSKQIYFVLAHPNIISLQYNALHFYTELKQKKYHNHQQWIFTIKNYAQRHKKNLCCRQTPLCYESGVYNNVLATPFLRNADTKIKSLCPVPHSYATCTIKCCWQEKEKGSNNVQHKLFTPVSKK
jgi:hypothetical protein